MSHPFTEKLHPGFYQQMDVDGPLIAHEKSQYQDIKIFNTKRNGRVMALDDIVQITTRDECGYSEMLTHVPMLEHGQMRQVMIVGGGDLAIAEEALKHRDIDECVNVEIDARVVDLCRQHFGEINAAAFADPRLKILIDDAFAYLGADENRERFDLIIADRPDPVGPAEVLFGDTFYQRVRDALAPGGFAVFQNGVPFFQLEELTGTLEQMKRTFRYCGVYLAVVPSYIGGFMALTWASSDSVLGDPVEWGGLEERFAARRLRTDYYTPAMHKAAFALPAWLARAVAP
ncbi:MAG TPA: polyamine aminopropyltransferase [Alphaproteobacteria bacterium]|nr:polyamine aminopropyltransferase [Alphaproteobacteria bacterium]HAJ46625.1 polyamine aminopropyltransferase [Alphaproteobacteria bacterium]